MYWNTFISPGSRNYDLRGPLLNASGTQISTFSTTLSVYLFGGSCGHPRSDRSREYDVTTYVTFVGLEYNRVRTNVFESKRTVWWFYVNSIRYLIKSIRVILQYYRWNNDRINTKRWVLNSMVKSCTIIKISNVLVV